jgi:transcription initiation factor TFIIIB Brf1 subunit/transcription initiation factor TFIIB
MENRLSDVLEDIIQFTKQQNQKKKQMFRHPKTVTIGAIFVFCCKVSTRRIQNLQFPQEADASHPIMDPVRLLYNPTTKKYQVKKVEKTDFNKFEETTARKLNEITTKRKQRKEGKKSISSQQLHLDNIFG